MNERPTKRELIEKEVDRLIKNNFIAKHDFSDYGTHARFVNNVKKGAITFNTTATVYGRTFEDLEEAKEFAKEETLRVLYELADNPPVLFFEYDEGVTPLFDGWPGVKIPKRQTWEKIYNILERKYGATTREAVENYVLRYSNTLDAGVHFHLVLDINYNPKVED